MAHIPSICGVCKGRPPKQFCSTESRYICNECVNFCHKMAHNWKELDNEEGSDPQSIVDKFNKRFSNSHP